MRGEGVEVELVEGKETEIETCTLPSKDKGIYADKNI